MCAQFERLSSSSGKKKAIVAIDRKLLVVVSHVLSKQEADRHADQAMVVRTMMEWARNQSTATRQGLTRVEFVRRELDRLGIGAEMDSFVFNGRTYHLPASASARLRTATAALSRVVLDAQASTGEGTTALAASHAWNVRKKSAQRQVLLCSTRGIAPLPIRT